MTTESASPEVDASMGDGTAAAQTPNCAAAGERDTAWADEPERIDPNDPDWQANAVHHLKHIARIDNEYRQTIQAFDDEIAKLEQRRTELAARYEARLEWHRRPLRALHLEILAADPKWKTITLPYGELASRTPKTPTVKTPDVPAFVEWAHTNAPDLLAATYRVDRKAVAAAIGDRLQPLGQPGHGEVVPLVTGDGEVVPGVTLGLDEITINIRPEGDW